MMKRGESAAWPSLVLQHGLGLLLLLGLIVGWGRRKEYAIAVVLLAVCWAGFAVLRKWQAASLPRGLQIVDWLFIAFIALIVLSFGMQGWGRPWVQDNIRLVPVYMITPYVCGRLMQAEDVELFSRGILVMLGIALALLLLSFMYVDDSYFQYRPQVAGSDEIAARIAHLAAQVGVVAVGLVLGKGSATWNRRTVWGFLLLTGLAVLLVFLGLRALVLVSLCVVALGCFKADWMHPWRRVAIACLYATVIFLSSAIMMQTSYLANKNGREVVGEVEKLTGGAGASAHAACSDYRSKYNSIAIRLELIQDAVRQFRSAPILGVGAGAFGQHSCWTGPAAHPHNLLMQVLSELGLVGGIVLVVMLGFAMLPALTVSWSSSAPMSLAASFFFLALLYSLVGGGYFTAIDLWWSLGLLVSLSSGAALR